MKGQQSWRWKLIMGFAIVTQCSRYLFIYTSHATGRIVSTISLAKMKSSHVDVLRGVDWNYQQDLKVTTLVNSDSRESVKERFFSCTKNITVVGWHIDLIDPLESFVREIQRLSTCGVHWIGTMNGSLDPEYISNAAEPDFLFKSLKGADIVLWWNWRIDAAKLNAVRKDYPYQTWVLLNRDDPFGTFIDGTIHDIIKNFDVVFTCSTATIPTYLKAGVKEVHAFVPAIDGHHFYDPRPEFECDVAMVITQFYGHEGSPRNRSGKVGAIARDARQTGFRFHIYGPETLGMKIDYPEFYKGPIDYLENRKVWSSAKISANFHVVDGYGGWYANARNTEILASRGLLVVDRAVEGPLLDMRECVFWRSDDPQDIVVQIHEILDDYDAFEPIRDRGHIFARQQFSPAAYATRVLKAVSRLRKLEEGK